MKSLKIYAILLTTSVLAMMSACGGDDTEDVKPDPKVNFKTTAGYVFTDASVGIDSMVKTGVIINHDRNITNVKFELTFSGRTVTIKDTTLKSKVVDLDFINKVISVPGIEKWTITATDEDGKTGSASFTLTITGADPTLVDFVAVAGQPNTKIYSKQSNKPLSALNLEDLIVYSAGVGVADNFKDVFDDNASTVSYAPKWASKTGVRFVKVTGGLDYAAATKYSQIVNYFNSKTSTAVSETLVKDNMYVLKGGDENRHYLVYIINIVDATGFNDDFVEIKIKALAL